MIQVIKNKARELYEPNIISTWTPTILSAYDDGQIQPELEKALPLFIHNIANSPVSDYISSDLIGTNNLNDRLINFTDEFDETELVSIIINAFSMLDTKGKKFDVAEGSKFSCVLNKQRKILSISDYSWKYTYTSREFNNEGINSRDFMIAFTCEKIAVFLQELINGYDDIVLYNTVIIKSYDESMMPTLNIIFKISLNTKVPLNIAPEEDLESDSDEVGEFFEEFNKRNKLNTINVLDDNSTVTEIREEMDETEYILSSTENERRLNRAIGELGRTVELIQEQSDNMGYVGSYCIGGQDGLRINVKESPNWFQRKMLKLFFNIEWYGKTEL